MSFFGLTRRPVQPDPMVAPAEPRSRVPHRSWSSCSMRHWTRSAQHVQPLQPNGGARARAGIYPQSPPRRHQASIMEEADPARGRLGGPRWAAALVRAPPLQPQRV